MTKQNSYNIPISIETNKITEFSINIKSPKIQLSSFIYTYLNKRLYLNITNP